MHFNDERNSITEPPLPLRFAANSGQQKQPYRDDADFETTPVSQELLACLRIGGDRARLGCEASERRPLGLGLKRPSDLYLFRLGEIRELLGSNRGKDHIPLPGLTRRS